MDFGGGAKAKNQLFQNMVILHIKLKGMKHTTTCKYFALAHILDPCQKVKTFFFLIVVILHIKLKGMKCTTTYKQTVLPLHTPTTSGIRSKQVFSADGHAAYQIKENEA